MRRYAPILLLAALLTGAASAPTSQPADAVTAPTLYTDILWRLTGTQFATAPGEYDIRVSDIRTIAQHGNPPRTFIYYADAYFVVAVDGPHADWLVRWRNAVKYIDPSSRGPVLIVDFMGVQ